MAHEPKRSTALSADRSSDVFPRFGGFTKTAKAGRSWRDDERGPKQSGGRPAGRK